MLTHAPCPNARILRVRPPPRPSDDLSPEVCICVCVFWGVGCLSPHSLSQICVDINLILTNIHINISIPPQEAAEWDSVWAQPDQFPVNALRNLAIEEARDWCMCNMYICGWWNGSYMQRWMTKGGR